MHQGFPFPENPDLFILPYAKGKIIDVSLYKHGAVVLCPYSVRMFRVP